MQETRYWYLAASAVLVLFYGYVVLLIFSPSPSQNYRLYFLDRKLEYWPQRDGLNYAFGDTIDFTQIVDYVSNEGWGKPESWGTWASGKKATLYLRTRPFDSGRVALRATVRIDAPPGRHVQAVRVLMDGKPVDTWLFRPAPGAAADWTVKRSTIPAGAMNGGGLHRLSFLIEGGRPANASAKGKNRQLPRLGFRTLQLKLIPAAPPPQHPAGARDAQAIVTSSRPETFAPRASTRAQWVNAGLGDYVHRTAAKSRSTSSRSAGVRAHSTARAFCTTCSGRVAPAITLATAGRAASQLKASSSRLWSRALQNASRRSITAQFSSVR